MRRPQYARHRAAVLGITGDIFGLDIPGLFDDPSSTDGGPIISGGGEFENPPQTQPGAPKKSGGTPGAVPFRPAAWDWEHSEYVIQPDDTMVGIATTYLGRGDRWGELRNAQTQPDGAASPYGNGPYLNRWESKWYPGSSNTGSTFRVGAVLMMPAEALERARALRDSGAPMAAAVGGSPGNKGSKVDPAVSGASGSTSAEGLPKWVPYAAGAVVVGGLLAAATMGRRRKESSVTVR